jgi:hypothetical protein
VDDPRARFDQEVLDPAALDGEGLAQLLELLLDRPDTCRLGVDERLGGLWSSAVGGPPRQVGVAVVVELDDGCPVTDGDLAAGGVEALRRDASDSSDGPVPTLGCALASADRPSWPRSGCAPSPSFDRAPRGLGRAIRRAAPRRCWQRRSRA